MPHKLTYPDLSKQCLFDTDASNKEMEAVLSQVVKGEELLCNVERTVGSSASGEPF